MTHRLLTCLCLITGLATGCGGGHGSDDAVPATSPAVVRPAEVLPVVSTAPAAAAQAGEPASELQRELALLRAEVADLRRRLDAAAAPPARPADVPSPPAAEDDRVRLARAEGDFLREVPDTAWSRTASQELQGALAQAGDGLAAAVQRIDCRARTCRIDLAAGAAASLDDLLPVLLGATGGGFTSAESMPRDPGDSAPGLLYLTR